MMEGFPASDIPLEQAVETGIRADAQYKNRLLDREAAALEQKKARMEKFFKLDASGSYLFRSRQMEISLPNFQLAPGVTVPGPQITAGSKHNYDLGLSLAQPLYTGGILANNVKLAAEKESIERQRAFLRRLELAGKIKASYFTYRLLENKKKSLALLIENLELHARRIDDFYREELVGKSDLLETGLKIAEVEMNLEESTRAMKEEALNFNGLCTVDIEAVERDYDEPVGTLAESLAFFKAHHPALKTIDHNIAAALLGRKIIAGRHLPRVSGFAELHYGRPGIDFFKDEWSLYVQGGIAVDVKVFDWNRLKRDKRIADISIERLENRKAALIDETKKALARLYTRMRSIERQLQLLEKLIKTSAEDAALKEEAYKEQQAANIDYLSALLAKERYQSMKNERTAERQLVKVGINTLIGRYGDEK
jgi:outer membrane protein TolC